MFKKRERNLNFCNSMDETGKHYAKLKSQTKTNTIRFHLYMESNKWNKLTNKIETEAWIHGIGGQLSEGKELGGGVWVKKSERIKQKTQQKLINTGHSIVMEGDLTLGGKHTMQYTDDLFCNYKLKTYIILLTNVTLINSIKF